MTWTWLALRLIVPAPTALLLGRLRSLLHTLKQLKHRQPQRNRNDLHRVKRRVGLAILNAAEVCLIETALFAEHHLRQALLLPQSTYT